MFYLVSFCSCDFRPFTIAITSLGEDRANLSAFRTFVRFVIVWICRFPLPLSVWEGLRFVIVALPGLFSYLFSNHFICFPPLLLAPFTVPDRIVFHLPKYLRCGHFIWVSASSPWLGDCHALWVHLGSCYNALLSSHGRCRKYSEAFDSISFQDLGFFFQVLP